MAEKSSAPAAASSTAWAGYCPDVERAVYEQQEYGAGGTPQGMHVLTEEESSGTVRAIQGLEAVKRMGLISRDQERCAMFFQGVGSPYMSKELVITDDPANPLAGDWVQALPRAYEGAVVQPLPGDGSLEVHNIEVVLRGTALVLKHNSGTFTLNWFGGKSPTLRKIDTFVFCNFDSAGKKINAILEQVGARTAERTLETVAIHQKTARQGLAEIWADNKFLWKCPVFKSKTDMSRWINRSPHQQGSMWYLPGKVEGAYYIAIRRDVDEACGRPEIYEVGFKCLPHTLWRKGPCPVFLKVEGRECPLVLISLEKHEYGGMSMDEIRTKEQRAQEERLEEIFGMPACITERPKSSCGVQ